MSDPGSYKDIVIKDNFIIPAVWDDESKSAYLEWSKRVWGEKVVGQPLPWGGLYE